MNEPNPSDPNRTHAAPKTDPDRTTSQAPTSGDKKSAETLDQNQRFDASTGEVLPVIKGYEITGEIARGGMGRVLAGIDLSLNREVAIKVLLPGAKDDRFVLESKITARLPHPNIPPVHALGTLDDGSPYLVMKRIRGEDLSKALKKRSDTKENLPHWIQVFESICLAVGFAHSKGIIHRDLKPANVMVGEFGEVQVMDWGLAKDLKSKEVEPDVEERRGSDGEDLTIQGAVMGTPSYMAPEQARGESIDARADVFALGGILTCILTGKGVFSGSNVKETIVLAASGQTEDALARLKASNADPELVSIAEKCLAVDAKDRPKNARAVADLIKEYREGVETRLRKAEATRAADLAKSAEQAKKRKALQWAGGVILAVSIIGIGVSSFFAWRASERAETEATAKKLAEEQTIEAQKQEGIAKEKEEIAVKATNRAENGEKLAKDNLQKAEWSVYRGKLLLADTALDENNLTLGRQYLEECQWNLRGPEYYHLLTKFDSKQTLKHGSAVKDVAWSPDGKFILTICGTVGLGGGEVKVWKADKPKEFLHLKGHTEMVTSGAFSPDGKRILTGSWDRTVKVWDVEKGTELLTLKGHRGMVSCVSWSPDGNRILTGSQDRTAIIWDAQKGTELLVLKEHVQSVTSVAWSPDSQKILTGSEDQTAKIWDALNGTRLLTLQKQSESVSSVAFSPDGRHILTGTAGLVTFAPNKMGEGKVWDAQNGTELFILKGQTNGITSVAWSPDGKYILTGNRNKTAKVWDSQKGNEIFTLKGHIDTVNCTAWSPDGQRILTGSGDSTIRVWDVSNEPGGISLKGVYPPHRMAWSPDGQYVLTGGGLAGQFGEAKVWNSKNGIEQLTIKGHTHLINCISWSPDGKRFITGSLDHTAKVWDSKKGTELLTLSGHSQYVNSVSFSPDGKLILTGSNDNTAKVWDAEKGSELLTLKGHKNSVTSVRYSPDGKLILTGSGDHTAKIWDAHRGTELKTLKGHNASVTEGVWSPNGKYIVTGSFDKTAKLWDTEKGIELFTFRGHTDGIGSLMFNSDGKRILTNSNDKTVKIWDVENGNELLTLRRNDSLVTAAFSPTDQRILIGGYSTPKICNIQLDTKPLTFLAHPTSIHTTASWSPNGKQILTGSSDKTSKLWDAEKGTEILSLKAQDFEVKSISFSPDGKRILTGSGSFGPPGEIKIWDVLSGTELLTLKGHTREVHSVAWSPNSKLIVTGSGDKTAKLWNAETGAEILTLKGHTQAVNSVAFCRRSKRIVTGSTDNTAQVWDATNGAELLTLKGHMNVVTTVMWSPDEKYILTGSRDRTAKLWNATNGTEIFTLRGHTGAIDGVSFSPDGRRIVTVSQDRAMKLWDVEKGIELHTIKTDEVLFKSVQFSPDGTRILLTHAAKVAIWDALVGAELFSLKGHTLYITHTVFSPDKTKLFAWDILDKVLAWDTKTGQPIPADNPPPKPATSSNSSISPDGRLAAKVDGLNISLIDLLKPPPPDKSNEWPLPTLDERKKYHTDEASECEKAKQYFAQAFHLGRLLLDDPDNKDLKTKREKALKLHEEANPAPKPKVDAKP